MPPQFNHHNAQDSDHDPLPRESSESPHTVSPDTLYTPLSEQEPAVVERSETAPAGRFERMGEGSGVRQFFSNEKVFVAGRWDQGAHHRAIEIARDLHRAGLWDAKLPIYINDAYKMHNAVYGVRKFPLHQLILRDDGNQITVILPPSPPSGNNLPGDNSHAVIGMGKFESPSTGDYLITIWQSPRGGWCYAVTHYRAGLPARLSIPGGDGWMSHYTDACDAARLAIVRHKATVRRAAE